tara:strand:+ start:481 stop:783 length:303 start_codon:yes stop_codon:yes gene_type:complete
MKYQKTISITSEDHKKSKEFILSRYFLALSRLEDHFDNTYCLNHEFKSSGKKLEFILTGDSTLIDECLKKVNTLLKGPKYKLLRESNMDYFLSCYPLRMH